MTTISQVIPNTMIMTCFTNFVLLQNIGQSFISGFVFNVPYFKGEMKNSTTRLGSPRSPALHRINYKLCFISLASLTFGVLCFKRLIRKHILWRILMPYSWGLLCDTWTRLLSMAKRDLSQWKKTLLCIVPYIIIFHDEFMCSASSYLIKVG